MPKKDAKDGSGRRRVARPERAAKSAGQMPRPLLYAAVSNHLRDMIVEMQLRPGQRINEQDLAEELAVSRTPLREALKVLASEGLIVLQPNRSSYVSRISVEETAELFEALAGVERIGGELITRRGDQADLSRLRSLHEEMFAFHSAGERAAYFALNDRIHRSFVELNSNARLTGFHRQLMVGATRIRYAAIHYNGRWDESVNEHKAILSAIEKRAWRQAGRLIEDHVLETGELACRILKQLDSVTPSS